MMGIGEVEIMIGEEEKKNRKNTRTENGSKLHSLLLRSGLLLSHRKARKT